MNPEEFLFSVYEDIPRQGPGNKASTILALSKVENLSAESEILDIGCGKGTQTFDLAEVIPAKFTAVDNHQPFVDFVNEKAKQLGLQQRVKAIKADMNQLPFAEKVFELIWAEGSIYNMGLENGLQQLRKFIKPGGCLVASEIAWFRNDPNEELKSFWDKEYPDMLTISEQLEIIRRSGYNLIDYFKLPKEAWLVDYYSFQETAIAKARVQYASQPELQAVLDYFELEINIYKKYSDFYGYVFYILKI